MAGIVHLGDERSAAGLRLAGVTSTVPAAGTEARALALARQDAALVLLDAGFAARLPPALLREAAAALSPLLLVLPDVDGRVPVPDLAERLRQQLGLSA